MVIAGQWVLLPRAVTVSGVDEVDGAFPLRDARHRADGRLASVRLAPAGQAERLEREATVLRGLQVPQVPQVLALDDVDGVGRALVLSRPPGETLEARTVQGLRIDGAQARDLARGLLSVLSVLHQLSPPVFHRNVHAGAVFWEQGPRVHLRDFARATDLMSDHQVDRVLPQPGYAPTGAATLPPAQLDLYGVGAVLVRVLSRVPPETLPHAGGLLQFRGHVHVDAPLLDYIERLLAPGTRRAFTSADEALAALPPSTPAAAGRGPLLGKVIAFAIAAAGAAGFLLFGAGRPAPAPVPVAYVQPAVPPSPAGPVVPAPSDNVRLEVTSEPSEAHVTVDGRALGSTPVRVQLPRGTRASLELRKAGYQTAQREIALESDVTVSLALVAAPAPRPVSPRPDDVANEEAPGLRALRTALQDQAAALKACNTEGVDRVRFRVQINREGRVTDVTPQGRAGLRTTECTGAMVRALRAPAGSFGAGGSADVLVWWSPAFKVAAY